MTWNRIALGATDILGLALILRLLALELHHVYKVFCLYMLFELFCSSISFFSGYFGLIHLNYNLFFIGVSIVTWVLTIWMIYALLNAMLAHLPGILKFSRRLLNACFLGAVLIALLTLQPDYGKTVGSPVSLVTAANVAIVIERVVSTVSLLALLAIQAFVLWFPVQMPKNLVYFSIGFVVAFVSEVVLLFVRGRVPFDIELVAYCIYSAWFAYLALSINRGGESVPVRIGHSWQKHEQERLIEQLEAVNLALLRGIRR